MSDLRNGQDTVAGSKSCTQCSRQLPLEDFPTAARTSSGRSSWCRECHRAASRRWRTEHAEEYNARRRRDPLPDRTCATCGETFTPKRSDGRYCSRPCLARSKLRAA